MKGIGLSLEDALMFWRNEFSRIHGIDGFEKHYAYNIRHNYGKEGRRTDYTPYSCLKIINGTVSAGEHHGCPFKHFDEERLKYNLQSQGVAASGITEIIQLVKGQHYQVIEILLNY
jgi:DNA primase large subunit